MIVFCKSSLVYLLIVEVEARAEIRAKPGVRPWEKNQKIETEEILLLIEAFEELLANLLSFGFTKEFMQGLL